jgi:hypothetical protein
MDTPEHLQSSPIHYNYHHHIDVRGVVIPTWVAILLSIMGFSASVVVLLAVMIFKDAAQDLAIAQSMQTREIRILDVHIQDIENLLIRSGLAKRTDFDTTRENKKEE